mmetsp:Transcript_74259/g.210212  ORF Transcript_74259/g.210212 Transcript_74259/m.210212 type:complete len:93 (+) Transcript_74259:226-504(+)
MLSDCWSVATHRSDACSSKNGETFSPGAQVRRWQNHAGSNIKTSPAGGNLSGGDNTNIYHDESPVAQTVVEFPTMIDIPVALSAAGEKLAEC